MPEGDKELRAAIGKMSIDLTRLATSFEEFQKNTSKRLDSVEYITKNNELRLAKWAGVGLAVGYCSKYLIGVLQGN